MGQRSELQTVLLDILGSDNVYFQPPSNTKMVYPCIVYGRDYHSINHADNRPYKNKLRYQVTVIDSDPDSDIPSKVAELPTCAFDRSFVADKLHHDVYTLYF